MEIQSIKPLNIVSLEKAFASNSVNMAIYRHHGIFTKGRDQYTSYYVDPQIIQVVKRNLVNGNIDSSLLECPFNGWDAHNTISMGFDRDGYIHMAICKHVSKFDYFVSARPGQIDGWTEQSHMTSLKETTVTYPTFVIDSNMVHPLLFLYRHGFPKKGEALLKAYSEKEKRWFDLETSILSGLNSTPSGGPYWNHPEYDPKGILHLSFVWRMQTTGRNTINNRGVCYSKSNDHGKSWFSAVNKALDLPITPDSGEIAYSIPAGSNLMNQTGMAVDSKGFAHVVMYSNDLDGIPQYQHVWFDGGHWHREFVSQRDNRFVLTGGGTLALPISRPEIVIDTLDRVYVIFRADYTDDKLSVLRLSPPDYDYSRAQLRILWDETVAFAEPVIDRIRWKRENILSVLVQKNHQPPNEEETNVVYEPIQIVDWDLVNGWR